MATDITVWGQFMVVAKSCVGTTPMACREHSIFSSDPKPSRLRSETIPTSLEGSNDQVSTVGTHYPYDGLDERLTAAIFCCVTALSLALVYYAARWGFQATSVRAIVETLAVSFFLLLFPMGFRRGYRALGCDPGATWVTSDPALSLYALLSLPLASMMGTHVGVQVLPAVVILGLGLFGVSVVIWFTRSSMVINALFLIGASLFGLWVSFATWGNGYHNPLYEEALAAGHYLCKDILVVSAITNTLKTYGLPSTGLDGIPYCWYHWGAYWFFAFISELEKMRVIQFVQLGYPVIFVPFLLCRFLEFSIHARECSARVGQGGLRHDGVFWLLFLLGWIGFIPLEVSRQMGFGTNLIFYSESYAVAAGCSFLVMSLALQMLRSAQRFSPALRLSDRCLVLLLPFLIAGIGLIKISQMYLLLLLFGYLFTRLKAWRFKTATVAFGASLLFMPLMVKLASPGGAAGAYQYIYPLAYFVSLVPLAWKPFFFLLYYWWPWVFVVARLSWQRVTTLGELKEALLEGKLIPVEVVVFLCIAGSAPAFILPIGGGSGVFFMEFQTWFALSLLLADSARMRDMIARVSACGESTGHGWRGVRLKALFALLVAACMLGSMSANMIQNGWRMVSQNLSVRHALLSSEADEDSYAAWKERLYTNIVRDFKALRLQSLKELVAKALQPLFSAVPAHIEHARGYPVVAALRDLDALPASAKRSALVWVPRSNLLFWQVLPVCEAVPLVVPALSGMAMIDGLPGPECKTYLGHYDLYPPRSIHAGLLERDTSALCAAVRAKGFSHAIILAPDQGQRMIPDHVPCP